MECADKKRIAWIDIFKGIGIIFVVLGHVINNEVIFNWIYSFHMPLFFFAGGCLYKKDTKMWNNVKRKFRNIMIPYFLYGSVVLVYWYLIERRFREGSQSLIEACWGLLSGEYQYLDFNVHLWFLPCFFLVVVVYNILSCLFKEKWVILISLVMAMLYSFIVFPELIWGAEKVFQYMIFYAMGSYLYNQKSNIKFSDKSLVLLALVCFVGNGLLTLYGYNGGILWFLVAMMGILPWVVVSKGIRNIKLLEYTGRISMVVLCVHGPIYRIIIKIISVLLHTTTTHVRENYLTVFLVVVITLFICSIVYEFVNRGLSRVLGRSAN